MVLVDDTVTGPAMNRHEGIACSGCGKVAFTGRMYRCLSCRDFDICADCYDSDFTTATHPFDHPVKCVYTPADVELYFGGEYISSDPPQSYRCPYCKRWGFNESTFLEHVSAQHVDASPLLVSTMVTLFEQQQAARLFLEDEQLASFSAAAGSRNRQMVRTHGSLDLYLEPLNPDGSYKRASQPEEAAAKSDEVTRERSHRLRRAATTGSTSTGPNAFSAAARARARTASAGFSAVLAATSSTGTNRNRGIASRNSVTTSSNRRQDRVRLNTSQVESFRFNSGESGRDFVPPPPDISFGGSMPASLAPNAGAQPRPQPPPRQPQPQPQPQPQQPQRQPQPNAAGANPTVRDMMRYYGSVIAGGQEAYRTPPSVRSQRARTRAWVESNNLRGAALGSGRNVVGPTSPLANGPHAPRSYLLPSDPGFSEQRLRAHRMTNYHQNYLAAAGRGGALSMSHQRLGHSQVLSSRTVDFNEIPMEDGDNMTINAAAAENLMRSFEEEPALAAKKRDQERQRYLCYRFLAPKPSRPPAEETTFLAHRSEFVAQLLASALCEENLQVNVAVDLPLAILPKQKSRPSCDIVGAGDAEKISPR
ncbi:uncharacterized protein [Drosophila bipectinata]|uniref:uncharacterized protein n=1 Tax=Drosophila bipectinata TaxID=42026 RepID=UPI001C8A0C64|nr:uncharacterized protein LOC108125412 [Drosophila bipectinata]